MTDIKLLVKQNYSILHFFPFHILLFLCRVTLVKGQFSNNETLDGWSFLHNLKLS